MSDTPSVPAYRTYLKAWVALLFLTVVMVYVQTAPILVLGIAAKAAIIAFSFMHLSKERLDFVLYMTLGIFGTALVLYVLIMADGGAVPEIRAPNPIRTY